MQLVGSLTSPFVRKIRVQLLEKNIPFSFIEDIPWNANTQVGKLNPLGKVPVLIDESGHAWFDSPVIAEFVESLEIRPRLLPIKSRAAVEVKQLEALADGTCEAGIAIFLERKRPDDKQSPEWIARQQGKLEAGLAQLAQIAVQAQSTGQEWLHNSGFSLADIAAGAMLDWIEFRLPEVKWAEKHPALNALMKKLNSRDSFKETIPIA
ncbi:MAG: glutathione S-transferase [Hahellaceae bacterium]|nr:glutathione S-transferase [Hahellaceae bacterium]